MIFKEKNKWNGSSHTYFFFLQQLAPNTFPRWWPWASSLERIFPTFYSAGGPPLQLPVCVNSLELIQAFSPHNVFLYCAVFVISCIAIAVMSALLEGIKYLQAFLHSKSKQNPLTYAQTSENQENRSPLVQPLIIPSNEHLIRNRKWVLKTSNHSIPL